MGQTITEKILSKNIGKEVKPGEFYFFNVDLAFGNEITIPVSIENFEKARFNKVFDKKKIKFFNDHCTPNTNIKIANLTKITREFAKKYGIKCYDVGEVGIEHAFIPEQGMVLPGDFVVGADSHSCTHGALGAFATGVGSTDIGAAMKSGKAWIVVPEQMRFNYKGKPRKYVTGKDLILHTLGLISVKGALNKTMEFRFDDYLSEELSMDSRLTMCNMATEAGAVNGIMNIDNLIKLYVKRAIIEKKYSGRKSRFDRDAFNKDLYKLSFAAEHFNSDPDAVYEKTYDINCREIELQVAYPFLPDNTKPISKAEKDNIKLDQVVIGSCTNGRMEDLRIAAEILKGKKVNKNTRTLIFPGTWEIYRKALQEGYIKTFVDAGCYVSGPTCGPCLGMSMGVLAGGEVALATTNRNFIGRMGEPENKEKGIKHSLVYLSGPAVAAASAIAGKIKHPYNVMRRRKR